MQEFIIELFQKIWLIIPFLIICMSSLNAKDFSETSFSKGWIIFSSGKTNNNGSEISSPDFKADESYRTNIPKTVFAALVEDGVYQNPYYGENLLNIPKEQFEQPWWYRKEFNIDEEGENINYQLNISRV